MKKLIILILLCLKAGCSVILSNDYFAYSENDQLQRVHLHDWVEHEPGPSIGGYRPPIYANKYEEQYYILYPILAESGSAAIGPPLIPIIPIENITDKKNLDSSYNYIKIRHYEKNSKNKIKPKSLRVYENDLMVRSCSMILESQDSIGPTYSCLIRSLDEQTDSIVIQLELENGHNEIFNLKRKSQSMYHPMSAINGPEPKERIEFE